MGLDAVVYRNKANINLGEYADLAKLDADTGEVYFEETELSKRFRDNLKAVKYRIGNISQVDYLRGEIIGLIGSHSQIITKVLYSGSHSGDVIPLSEMPVLAEEIQAIEKHSKASKDVLRFLDGLRKLFITARYEGNPIVFV